MRRYPASGYADNALWQAAGLRRARVRRFRRRRATADRPSACLDAGCGASIRRARSSREPTALARRSGGDAAPTAATGGPRRPSPPAPAGTRRRADARRAAGCRARARRRCRRAHDARDRARCATSRVPSCPRRPRHASSSTARSRITSERVDESGSGVLRLANARPRRAFDGRRAADVRRRRRAARSASGGTRDGHARGARDATGDAALQRLSALQPVPARHRLSSVRRQSSAPAPPRPIARHAAHDADGCRRRAPAATLSPAPPTRAPRRSRARRRCDAAAPARGRCAARRRRHRRRRRSRPAALPTDSARRATRSPVSSASASRAS